MAVIGHTSYHSWTRTNLHTVLVWSNDYFQNMFALFREIKKQFSHTHIIIWTLNKNHTAGYWLTEAIYRRTVEIVDIFISEIYDIVMDFPLQYINGLWVLRQYVDGSRITEQYILIGI